VKFKKMEITPLVTDILSILTIIGDVFIAGFLVVIIYNFVYKKNFEFDFIKENSLILAFFVALLATLGSLFYSEIAGYNPCKLCWFQRVFMYPQAILFGTALIRKAKNIFYYSVPLSLIGLIIAVYHYISQIMEYSSTCGTEGVACTVKYTFHFGYITIPMMAVTAFLLIIIFSYLWKEK